MSSYNTRRARWSKKVQDRFAMPIYQEIWPGCRIDQVDKYAEKSEWWKRRDFSGLDTIINLSGGNEIHLSQRFRSADSGDDFSLRYMVPSPKGLQKSEFFKLLKAYKKGYYRPDKYAFGKTKFGKHTNPDKETDGLSFIYIFNVDPILKAIIDGDLTYRGPHQNRDGSYGVYFTINDMPQEAIFFERVWNQERSYREPEEADDLVSF